MENNNIEFKKCILEISANSSIWQIVYNGTTYTGFRINTDQPDVLLNRIREDKKFRKQYFCDKQSYKQDNGIILPYRDLEIINVPQKYIVFLRPWNDNLQILGEKLKNGVSAKNAKIIFNNILKVVHRAAADDRDIYHGWLNVQCIYVDNNNDAYVAGWEEWRLIKLVSDNASNNLKPLIEKFASPEANEMKNAIDAKSESYSLGKLFETIVKSVKPSIETDSDKIKRFINDCTEENRQKRSKLNNLKDESDAIFNDIIMTTKGGDETVRETEYYPKSKGKFWYTLMLVLAFLVGGAAAYMGLQLKNKNTLSDYQSKIEELQSENKSLQSTIAELQTKNEELQTKNEELPKKIDELIPGVVPSGLAQEILPRLKDILAQSLDSNTQNKPLFDSSWNVIKMILEKSDSQTQKLIFETLVRGLKNAIETNNQDIIDSLEQIIKEDIVLGNMFDREMITDVATQFIKETFNEKGLPPSKKRKALTFTDKLRFYFETPDKDDNVSESSQRLNQFFDEYNQWYSHKINITLFSVKAKCENDTGYIEKIECYRIGDNGKKPLGNPDFTNDTFNKDKTELLKKVFPVSVAPKDILRFEITGRLSWYKTDPIKQVAADYCPFDKETCSYNISIPDKQVVKTITLSFQFNTEKTALDIFEKYFKDNDETPDENVNPVTEEAESDPPSENDTPTEGDENLDKSANASQS